MNIKSVWLAPLLIGCSHPDHTSAAAARLTYHAPSELANIVRRQAYESRLDIAGIALRDTTLYVATNVGLLDIRGSRLVRIAQWLSDDNVVSGPWYDERGDRMWVKRDHDNVLFYQHDSVWTQVSLPKPPNGQDYTRGDILEGFRGISDSTAFRLLGAGTVWRWDDSTWRMDGRPPTDPLNATIGFGRVAKDEVMVVTSGSCAYLPCTNQAYWRTSEGWQQPLRLDVKSVEDVVSASGAVYARGNKGELLRIDRDSVAKLMTPGFCEAIARTAAGKLIASFRGVGLFLRDTGWTKRFDDPSDPRTGEQQAFIAERGGRVAFATTTVSQLRPGSSDKFVQSGNLGVWISEGAKLVRIPLAQ